MRLSILLPTYNREKYLIKNLRMLFSYITNNNLVDKVNVIVSNNCSPDETDKEVRSLINELDAERIIRYYCQESNIGLEGNALFTLSKAESDYVMYLGDDDYIQEEYLLSSLEKIDNDKSIHCILPSFISIDINGVQKGKGRDAGLSSKMHEGGFKNCYENSWRGHQISGLILKRENLYKAYIDNKASNIYPFIFFVTYCCMNGRTWHIPEYPVSVTNPGQQNKDWGYGEDGLISEMFDNYVKMPYLSYIQKARLQLKILNKHSWRYTIYAQKGIKIYAATLFNIIKHKNTLWMVKFIFPFVAVIKTAGILIRKIKRSKVQNGRQST